MKRYKFKEPENNSEEVMELPPRSNVHKSDRTVFTRWFYRILAISFIVLTVGLLLWGFLAPDE